MNSKKYSATYRAVDGASQKGSWNTLAGLAGFVDKWAGRDVQGNAAVSSDGIGRVVFNGATAEQLEAHWAAPAAPAAPAARVPAAIKGAQVVFATGKPYRTAAQHNMDWWTAMQAPLKAGDASLAGIAKAGVPAHFVGYCVRRGYLGVKAS